jgi:hypothetical protein
MRRFSILLVAVPLAASACGDDEVDPVFLGALDASPVDAASPDVVQPDTTALPVLDCPNSPTVVDPDIASIVRSIGTLGARGIITQRGSVRALQLETGSDKGCPSAPIASFGTNGTLAIDATAAAPLPNTLSIVAVSDGTLILDSTGTEIGRCPTNGEDLVVRSLQANANGEVAAAFTKAPVSRLTVTPTNCAIESFTLSSPFVFVQVGLSRDGGFVTVEQASATSALVVARYDSQGEAVSSSELFATAGAAKLCSATGLVDTPAGIFVTDTTCRRVVLFEEFELPDPPDGSPTRMLQATGETAFEDTPIGAALTPDESHVLIAVAQTIENGAVANFKRIKLP